MTWTAFGASVIGVSHLRAGRPCQDAHAYRAAGGLALAAVADGLGSAARAEAGARAAADSALDALAQTPPPADAAGWQVAVRAAFEAARGALEKQAEAEGRPLRDYAATLLVAVLAEGWTATGQVGDGAIVAQLADGSLRLLSAPQRGEYANETRPLTAADALDNLQVNVLPEPALALALFSDGLQNLALRLASGEPHAPFFAPFFAPAALAADPEDVARQLAEFLASERVCARTDDDKTLVVLGRKP